MHGVLALGLFAGAVALASYIPGWKETSSIVIVFTSRYERVVSTSEATVVSLLCFFACFFVVVDLNLSVYICVGVGSLSAMIFNNSSSKDILGVAVAYPFQNISSSYWGRGKEGKKEALRFDSNSCPLKLWLCGL